MPTVHDFSEYVFQIVIRDLLVFCEIIVQDVGTDIEVTVIEVIAP
jgi:hypothetical protein